QMEPAIDSSNLTEKQKEVVKKRLFERRTLKDIGQDSGTTRAATEKHEKKALRKLGAKDSIDNIIRQSARAEMRAELVANGKEVDIQKPDDNLKNSVLRKAREERTAVDRYDQHIDEMMKGLEDGTITPEQLQRFIADGEELDRASKGQTQLSRR